MPGAPRLGEFRANFAGVVGMVESRDERDIPGVDKVETTVELLARLEERGDEQVDARDYLRARLIDIFVGDWDRHLDQWRWVRFKEGGLRVWRARAPGWEPAHSQFSSNLSSIAGASTKQLVRFRAGHPRLRQLSLSRRHAPRRVSLRADSEH